MLFSFSVLSNTVMRKKGLMKKSLSLNTCFIYRLKTFCIYTIIFRVLSLLSYEYERLWVILNFKTSFENLLFGITGFKG